MTTKVYGIYGRTTAIVRIPTGSGKANIEVTFDRGVPNAGPNYRPATFTTNDPVVQKIMESNKLFGSLYKIVRVVRDDNDAPAPAKKAAAPKPVEPEQLEGITTKLEAIEYLKSKGAKAKDLKDDESIKKYAEKIGVAFPNLN